jgi:hypothetical protein
MLYEDYEQVSLRNAIEAEQSKAEQSRAEQSRAKRPVLSLLCCCAHQGAVCDCKLQRNTL